MSIDYITLMYDLLYFSSDVRENVSKPNNWFYFRVFRYKNVFVADSLLESKLMPEMRLEDRRRIKSCSVRFRCFDRKWEFVICRRARDRLVSWYLKANKATTLNTSYVWLNCGDFHLYMHKNALKTSSSFR